jgi:hypothetical protein
MLVIPEASQRLSGTAGSAELAAVPALRFATAGMTGYGGARAYFGWLLAHASYALIALAGWAPNQE